MKILLTGKDGQVGFELQRSLAPLGEIVAVDLADCDLSDAQAIRQLVATVLPDIIVNPAAYTAVDKAESDQERAAAVNAIAPGIFGEEAAKLGALVVHYSTDYVFDGTKDGAYCEADSTNPQSVYGRTKRDGELALANTNPRHLILRTSWVVGAHGGNFAKTMLKLAADRDSLNVVADQWGVPTSAALLADIAAHLVRQQRSNPEAFPYGTYHCVAGGETKILHPGDAIAESVGVLHNGRNIGDEPVKIVAFFTGEVGNKISIAHPEFAPPPSSGSE